MPRKTRTLRVIDQMLNDALVYLTAAKFGLPVLTENKGDFDLIPVVLPADSDVIGAAVGV